MVSPGKALLFLVTAALFAAWAFTLRPAFLGGPAGYVMVSGTSMEPTLYGGDLVITRRQADYGRGDIVAFRVEGGTVIHRIIGGNGVAGFEVQGDNKDAPDQWRPTNRDIVGKLWLRLPEKGRWLAWTREPRNLSAIVGGLAAMTLVGGGAQARKGRFRTSGGGTSVCQQTGMAPAVRRRTTWRCRSGLGRDWRSRACWRWPSPPWP